MKLGYFFFFPIPGEQDKYQIFIPFILLQALQMNYKSVSLIIPSEFFHQFSRIDANRFEEIIALTVCFRMNLLNAVGEKSISLKEFYPNAIAKKDLLETIVPVLNYNFEPYDYNKYSEKIKNSIEELGPEMFFKEPGVYLNKPRASSFDILIPHPATPELPDKCFGLISIYSSEYITTSRNPYYSAEFESKVSKDFTKSIKAKQFIGENKFYLGFFSNQVLPQFDDWQNGVPGNDKAIVYCNQNIEKFLGIFASPNIYRAFEEKEFFSNIPLKKLASYKIGLLKKFAKKYGVLVESKDKKVDIARKLIEKYCGTETAQEAKEALDLKKQQQQQEEEQKKATAK